MIVKTMYELFLFDLINTNENEDYLELAILRENSIGKNIYNQTPSTGQIYSFGFRFNIADFHQS